MGTYACEKSNIRWKSNSANLFGFGVDVNRIFISSPIIKLEYPNSYSKGKTEIGKNIFLFSSFRTFFFVHACSNPWTWTNENEHKHDSFILLALAWMRLWSKCCWSWTFHIFISISILQFGFVKKRGCSMVVHGSKFKARNSKNSFETKHSNILWSSFQSPNGRIIIYIIGSSTMHCNQCSRCGEFNLKKIERKTCCTLTNQNVFEWTE